MVSYNSNVPDLIAESKKITKIVDYWPGLSSRESTNYPLSHLKYPLENIGAVFSGA